MRYLVDGKPCDLIPDPLAEVTPVGDRLMVEGYGTALVRRHKGKIHVSLAGVSYALEPNMGSAIAALVSGGELKAPLPSTVVDVLFKVGDQVKKGDKVVVLEAMKMQAALSAPFDGEVTAMNVKKGEQIKEGFVAAVITAPTENES